MAYTTKDSGQREEFETGSRRDTRDGKGRFDLLFGNTRVMRRMAGLYERGATKYGDNNWQKGQPIMRYVDSLLRHLAAVIDGKEDEDHAAGVIWNAIGIMWTLDMVENNLLPPELDDRPQYDGVLVDVAFDAVL